MRANRGRDTGPELALRRLLHARGFRFRVDYRVDLVDCRARPDIAFPRAKVAVFVDGCFWHGCPKHAEWPARNGAFWREKILGNRARDERQTRALQAEGWKVVRVWEHEPPADALAQVAGALGGTRAAVEGRKP